MAGSGAIGTLKKANRQEAKKARTPPSAAMRSTQQPNKLKIVGVWVFGVFLMAAFWLFWLPGG
jgi:hypothetical protein